MVVLKITLTDFKDFKGIFVEAYNIEERRVKLNNRTSFHRKILIAFADNIGLINY